MKNKPAREQILATLAHSLEDSTLKKIFPESNPGEIRRLIAGDGALFKPDKTPSNAKAKSAKQSTLPDPTKHKGTCKLFTDGASRGNPGEAGAGAVLWDQSGVELATVSRYIGTCTNNVAEYKALIFGLEQAEATGCDTLSIHMDSELIVRQIQGRYKVKNESLKPLYQEAIKKLTAFKTWSINHVPRSQNKQADKLANLGIDTRAS